MPASVFCANGAAARAREHAAPAGAGAAQRSAHQIRVDLDAGHREAAGLEQHADAAAGDTLAQATHHTARNDDVLHGCSEISEPPFERKPAGSSSSQS